MIKNFPCATTMFVLCSTWRTAAICVIDAAAKPNYFLAHAAAIIVIKIPTWSGKLEKMALCKINSFEPVAIKGKQVLEKLMRNTTIVLIVLFETKYI